MAEPTVAEKLEQLRSKEQEDFTEEDKALIKAEANNLSPEDKEAYKSIINESEAAPLRTEGEGEPETGEEKKPKPAKSEGEAGTLTFKNQEEFDAAINKAIEARAEAKRKVKEEAETKKKAEEATAAQPQFFPEDFEPKSWNELAVNLFTKLREFLKDADAKDTEQLSADLTEIEKGFDEEIEGLRTAGEPIPEAGTEERKALDRELAQIGVDYDGVTNMTQAYQIYKVLHSAGTPPAKPETPPTTPEGEEDKQKQEEEAKKKAAEAKRKSLAGKVGRGSGNDRSPQLPKHTEIHGRSMDELIEPDIKAMEGEEP